MIAVVVEVVVVVVMVVVVVLVVVVFIDRIYLQYEMLISHINLFAYQSPN